MSIEYEVWSTEKFNCHLVVIHGHSIVMDKMEMKERNDGKCKMEFRFKFKFKFKIKK